MSHILDCDHPSSEWSGPEADESAKLRRQRELDEAWDEQERERREAEINRRVIEQWRGPFT